MYQVNTKKTREINTFDEKIMEFEYLGYKIHREEKKSMIVLNIGIAYKKVKKIKNKIFLAFYDYNKNKKFSLLKKRILYLATSFPLKDRQQRLFNIVKTGTLNKRQISLIHPISQFKACDFYDKYAQLILYYCNKSSYSLRHPYRKTSIVHKKYSHLLSKFIIQNDSQDAQVKNIYEEIEEDAENLKPEDFLTNYFIYKKYNMLYKFYNSDEYIDLGKKYRYLLKLDISRCFDSIYTHSISWSVKSKDYVKNNLAKLDKENCFSDEFDNLMQSSNYLETNGIPIGAEVSRIFAEIILQRIDNQIHQRVNKNLAIRRYVDDYYIFFNDINQLDIIEGN